MHTYEDRNYYVPQPAKGTSARRRLGGRPPSRRKKARRRRILRHAARLAAMAGMAIIMAVSAGRIAGYAADYLMARRASDALRKSYYEEELVQISDEEVALSATPVCMESPAPTVQQPAIAVADETAAPPAAQQPADALLQAKPYPANPKATVKDRFKKLRRQNKDIIGWLTVDGMLDEAVVKRDNAYYLQRDYRGYHNVNGAIFVDERCDLSTRPYTIMLFGHNMKTGMMFGRLRDYENIRYYREHPFITFDTAYENGRYVVFSAATIGLDPAKKNYLDLNGLLGDRVKRRERAISRLKELSVHTAMIEVDAHDQILLLVTCVEDDMERRVIAARRVRTGESEEQLARWVQQVDHK